MILEVKVPLGIPEAKCIFIESFPHPFFMINSPKQQKRKHGNTHLILNPYLFIKLAFSEVKIEEKGKKKQ